MISDAGRFYQTLYDFIEMSPPIKETHISFIQLLHEQNIQKDAVRVQCGLFDDNRKTVNYGRKIKIKIKIRK